MKDFLGYYKRLLVMSEMITLFFTGLFVLYHASVAAENSEQQYYLPDLATQVAQQQELDRLNSLANMTLTAGKAIQNNTEKLGLSDSTEQWLIDQLSHRLTNQMALQGATILQDYGQPNFALKSDISHHFVGSTGSFFKPLQASHHDLWFSQLNVNETDPGLLASFGLGRRWSSNNWIFGYNAFVDHLFAEDQNRATFGSELWSDYLLVSANYFSPLNNWHINDVNNAQLMSHGFDLHTRGMLPFYRQISISLGWQYYLDDDINEATGNVNYHNPQSLEVGLSYHPIPLITLSALHKKYLGGEYKNQLGIQLNYQFGVDLKIQFSRETLENNNKYALNSYTAANRYSVPDLPYQTPSTFQVYLATPALQVHPGESLALRIIVTQSQKIEQLQWQGDSEVLSLTPPSNKHNTEGWTVIMPRQQLVGDGTSDYSLAVVVDNGKQRVRSNTIHFSLSSFNDPNKSASDSSAL